MRVRYILLLALLLNSAVVIGEPDSDLVRIGIRGKLFTTVEVALLPPVCKLIFRNGKLNGKTYWYDNLKNTGILDRPEYQMARDAPWLHHWCFSQVEQFRYRMSRTDRDKKHWGSWAYDDLNFCITHSAPEHWEYLPLMYFELGQLKMFDRHYGEAIDAFKKALQLDPNYARSYASLADALMKMGREQKALRVIEVGLTRRPDSQMLQRRLEKIKGDMARPKEDATAETE